MKIKNKIAAMILSSVVICYPVSMSDVFPVIVAEAHSGRTDSHGGHKDNKNKSGLGSYHYHCGGYSAHLHPDGVCPYSGNYAAAAGSGTAKTSSASASAADKELIKQVQQALNDKGYDCGTADGIMGKKSKQALKDFQKDNGLTEDGIIGDQVKEALGIS